MRAWTFTSRPYWASHPKTSHPVGGWHLVDASGRWHLYAAHSASGSFLVWRFCDDAESVHARLPRLRNGELLEPRTDEAICPSCWHTWERILALPDGGFGHTTIGGSGGAHAGNLSSGLGRGSAALTSGDGLT